MWFFLSQAYKNLVRNKIRTLLTSLGIFIGVFSVVILIAFGVGLRVFVQDQFNSLGSNILIILPGQVLDDNGQFQDREGGFGESKFDESTVAKLERISTAKYVAPAFIRPGQVSTSSGKSASTSILGTNDQMFPLRDMTSQAGSIFTKSDVRKKSNNVVLGDKIARELFTSPATAIGKIIRIESVRYQVKGVLNPKGGGGFGGPDFDAFVYMPYTAGTNLNPSGRFVSLYVQATNAETVQILKENIKSELIKDISQDDFSIIEQTQIMGTVQGIFSIINSILVALGSISLIVGGVGIMNIMYASVNERIKEIGIRRSLGATQSDILIQFLFESVIVSLLGGIGGLLLAWIIAIIANRWIPVQIDLLSVVVAISVSSLIGISFGVFPARRAANWPPIDAIRN